MIELALIAVAAIPGAYLLYERFGWLRRRSGHRVIVHTDGATYDGLLTKSASDGLVLLDVTLTADNEAPMKPAGQQFVPKSRVVFIQTDV